MPEKESAADISAKLVKRIQDGERELLPELWEQIDGLAKHWANRYAHALSEGNVDKNERDNFDNLYQNGYIAMCEAVDTYKPDTGNAFSTWFTYYFKQHLYSERGWRWRLNKETGKGETYCADMLGNADSLNRPVGDEDDTELEKLVEDRHSTESFEEVERRIFNAQLRAVLDECLATLPEAEREAITGSYYNGLTLQEMADRAGISIERIRQRQAKGLRALRRGKNIKTLTKFYNECRGTWGGSTRSISSNSDIYSAGLMRGNSTERAALDMTKSGR